MKGSEAETPNAQLTPTASKERRWLVAGAFSCILFGGFMAWGIHALWQLDDIRITSTLEEQMMHRKSRTMAEILDGLVHSNMRSVEKSAEHMKSIGVHLNWYSSSELYENNNERFRQSVLDLIEAGKQGDHDAAKESALRLERSCIECHALINRENNRHRLAEGEQGLTARSPRSSWAIAFEPKNKAADEGILVRGRWVSGYFFGEQATLRRPVRASFHSGASERSFASCR